MTSSKWGVSGIVKDHYETFVDAGTGRPRLSDYATMVAVPIMIGMAVWLRDGRLESSGELLGGVGIFTGGLFALLLQVFPVSQRLTDDPRLAGQRRIGRLVDELEANASYAVLVGLVVTGLLVVIAASTGEQESASRLGSALAATGLTHLLLSSLMTLKRLRALFRRTRT